MRLGPSPTRRAFLDTSVLYPISLLDLFMRLAEGRVHELVLTDDLLDELDGKWQEGRAQGKRVPTEASARSAFDGIRRTFADSFVSRDAYEDAIEGMPGTDPDDWPHIAAAVAGAASHVVTRDKQGGFPPAAIAELGISVQHPDEYLRDLAEQFPQDVAGAIQRMAERRDLGPEELLERWRRMGLQRFTDTLRSQFE